MKKTKPYSSSYKDIIRLNKKEAKNIRASMDGLIPMVYRAVKKNLTRRRYERLSSSSRTTRESYDMEMNVDGQHRRRWCIGDNSSLSSRETKRRAVGAMEKGCSPPHEGHQLVRFKNHRLFSCITGQ